jgi:hypothetical protein
MLSSLPVASELDALGAAAFGDLLKGLALLDMVVTDVELGQRPHIPDGIGDSSRTCDLNDE